MPLSHRDQLFILADILKNHQTDCSGTTSECEQIQRLANSLQQNNGIAPEIKQILNQIEQYSVTGATETNLLNHIETHQPHLSQWVDTIDRYQ
ncbi:MULTISPECIES: YtzH-like family protein [Bacillales]|uniref:YtzH-like family protein n=1 Tax=Bacillales TaxID=1385 RepID=UPI0018835043|nr:YtzH-like family protein [Pseudalkalibacillus hwajinpoensis]MBF0706189.1 YtzH-like family protein [Pseudalkalibacillus hwajinpoensis]